MNPDARVDDGAGDTSHRGWDFTLPRRSAGPSPILPLVLPQFSTKQGLPEIFQGYWGLVSPVPGNFQEGVFLEECTFLQGVEEMLAFASG